VYRGRTTWEPREEFNFKEFTYFTDDERYVSMKRNYKNEDYQGWSIFTDEYGFRSGKQKLSETANIVFLGDSVPFGWGVDAEGSVPSILHEILSAKGIEIGIINAASPAYSLDQAVQRYMKEVAGKFPSDVIVLQTYDPAAQFTLLGRKWDVSINWTTLPPWFEHNKSDVRDYSALSYLFRRYLGKEEQVKELLEIGDKTAVSKFSGAIVKTLNALQESAADAEKILLLPVTVPRGTWDGMTDKHRTAINAMNAALMDYAEKNNKVLYVDTVSLFKDHDDEEIFIDRCCHLSPYGARLQAGLISGTLLKSNLRILQ
ncbi:MAG: SGNH/GDSL hydrolase family protein, partial [Nitrospirota bacterium]|nr:SGNH/GDSL hydrolase family protein [Nitrospirota bacterium]